MADTITDHMNQTLPEDGASEDTWGIKLNIALNAICTFIYQLVTNANYAANTGTANALAAAIVPAPEALVIGQRVWISVAAANTAGVTLDLNGLGVKSVKLNDGSALTAGVLKAGGIYCFVYDGTDFRLGERAAATAADALLGTDNAKTITASALAGLNSTVSGVDIIKLPGGYMIQAGTYAGAAANPAINFPIAFSAPPRVTLTAVSTGNNTNSSSEAVRLATLAGRTAAGFTTYTSGESEISDVFVGKAIAFDWIAVGRVATS